MILCIFYALLLVMIVTPYPYSFAHIVYITWQDFRVKHVCTYVFYIEFPGPLFLLYVWVYTFV